MKIPRTGKISLLIIALLGAIGLVLWQAEDRSCHARIGLGPNSNTSRLDTSLEVPSSEWPEVEQVFRDFANDNGWSIRSGENNINGGYRWLELCDDALTTINVGNVLEDHTVNFRIIRNEYGEPRRNGWRIFYRAIHERLEAHWPGRMTYVQGDNREPNLGEAIERPEWLGATD